MPHPAAVPPATATHFRVLRTVPNYTEARQVVDALSDARFPIEHVRVVGTGLRLVEQITGRMTYGRAAVLGAGTGAWLGLFLGLLLGILTLIGWWPVLMWTLVLGAIWGLVLGLVAHAATGGRRDFSSVQAWRRMLMTCLSTPTTSTRRPPRSTAGARTRELHNKEGTRCHHHPVHPANRLCLLIRPRPPQTPSMTPPLRSWPWES